AVAGKQTETWPLFKVSTVCLGLLCFLLLTTAIVISILCEFFKRQKLKWREERGRRRTDCKCPDGWRRFGCSCYFFSTSVSTWSRSKQMCQLHGADLVIINSQSEMMFLNKVRAHSKFWIGMDGTSSSYSNKWTDGSSLKTTLMIIHANSEHNTPSYSNDKRHAQWLCNWQIQFECQCHAKFNRLYSPLGGSVHTESLKV
uniref:C-type lectin domain-containing protein n=1 Tax=Labrus bergylta TaxID=56723 RepID=A0A3Q3EU04_9LABR